MTLGRGPYRTPATLPLAPPRSWRCWVGWHAWSEVFVVLADHHADRVLVKMCRRCHRQKTIEIVRAVSQDFIDGLRAYGARSELVDRLQRDRDRIDAGDDPIIVARIDASVPGSRLQVTDLVMSETTRRALTAGSVRAPPPKNPGSLKEQPR